MPSPRRALALASAGLLLLVAATSESAAVDQATEKPNIVFLVVESTSGDTWTPGYERDAIPLPNIRRLQENGGRTFINHYANAPVCCPSRATFWSGRHAHHLPHLHNGIRVGGAWNNYEGLPANYSDRIDQVLARETNYTTLVTGKRDWESGSHTINVRLNSWTMYARFPYDVNATGGWHDESEDCHTNGTVLGHGSAHQGDWDVVNQNVKWIRNKARHQQPFFIYQGMNIVHPPYATNQTWYDVIDPDKVSVPEWPALEDMHPCDLQSSMLKGCLPSDAERDFYEDTYRRRNVRRIYYAMIAEFDAMVGAYLNAINDAQLQDNTVWIVTSDHGDMKMERRQFYKMVPYESSASVPMVIFDGRSANQATRGIQYVTVPTQLIDIMPTVLDLAQVSDHARPDHLDGRSLVPLLSNPADGTSHAAVDPKRGGRPPFVVSQFHGCNIAASWFAIVYQTDESTFKLIKWGTGAEVPTQLYDLQKDSEETHNLAADPSLAGLVRMLDAALRSVVDYPSVAREVASYGLASFRHWQNVTSDWRSAISQGRWSDSWNANATASMLALEDWLRQPAQVLACRAALKWPEDM